MRRLLTLSVLPAVGLTLFVLAFLWSQRDLRLRFLGQATEGRIVGMAVERADGRSDLLTGQDTDLVLVRAGGDRVLARYRNYARESVAWIPRPGAEPEPLTPAEVPEKLGPETTRVLDEAGRGDAEIIRWAMLRESRRGDDPRRIIRLEKTETTHAYLDLAALPTVLTMRDGHASLDPADPNTPPPGTITITTVFDRSDPALVQKNKGESLVRYDYRRNGQPVTPAKKNFFLFAEPYATEFRPVFGFEVAGTPIARISQVGRHGGPTLALRLFEGGTVYFDPAQPSEAILTALPGAVNGDPLGWFSRLCEGIFAQWGSTALIFIAGLMFLVVGASFISLALWPSKKITLVHAPPASPHGTP